MATPRADDLTTSSSISSIFGKVCGFGSYYLAELGEGIAGYSAGQFLFRKTDDLLRTVEKSVQWSVQPQINPPPLEDTVVDKKGNECLMTNGSKKSKIYPGELVRPLPWVFFIPLLLIIRAVRKGAELQAWLFKTEVTTPKHMVRYIQGMRRRLRAVKYRGMRNARAGAAALGDADKSTLSTASSLSMSKAKQQSDGSTDLGSDPLGKRNKRKQPEESSSDEDDDDDNDAVVDVDAMDAEGTPDRHGNYLSKLLETSTALSDSDNDPDFQPNSSMEDSMDSDALGSDASDDDSPPFPVEVKRLSQPTSLINADIIEEEGEDSVLSSTLSVSEADDPVERKFSSETFHSAVSCGPAGVADGEGHGPPEETGSEYDSCAVSLSAKSVDIASSIEQSDRSDSSRMQRMSSLFKKKKPVDVKPVSQ